MTRARRLLVGLTALGWLVVGLYGVSSYGHNYYVYRGYSPPHNPPGVPGGRTVDVSFRSQAMRARRSYVIYLPPGYDRAAAAGRRFPVLYLLHGAPGWPRLFLDVAGVSVQENVLLARREIRPMLIVMVDGRDGTYRSDTEWANTPHGQYEGLVLDAVRAVDRRWATIAQRGARTIAGNSEGAYGAVNITLHHLETFGVVESWSGYFRQDKKGAFKRATPAQLRANSPETYLPDILGRLRALPLRASIFAGRSDREAPVSRRFAPELAAAGARVSYYEPVGTHSWSLWRSQIPSMLRFADRGFAHGSVR